MDSQSLTKKDFDASLERFAGMVNAGFQEVHKEIRSVDAKVEAFKSSLDAKIESVKKEVLESNEKIATEVQAMRAEQAAVVGGRQRIDDTLLEHGDTLTDHSRRIGVLEGRSAVA